MKTLVAMAVLVLGCGSTTAEAAVPTFGGRDGDLTCVGLLDHAFRAVAGAKPQKPDIVVAMTAAYSFYIGRLSKADPSATKADAQGAIGKLTPEEKNAYSGTCMTKAAQALSVHLN